MILKNKAMIDQIIDSIIQRAMYFKVFATQCVRWFIVSLICIASPQAAIDFIKQTAEED